MNILILTKRSDWTTKFYVVVTIVAMILSTFPVSFFIAQAEQPAGVGVSTVNICKANQSSEGFVSGVMSVPESAINVGLANSGQNYDIVENGQNWDFVYPNGFTGAEIFAADCNTTINGSISGAKYEDIDNDGSISGDDGIENWEIRLYEVDTPWVLLDTQMTDSDGEYEFLDLGEGQYKVCEVMKDNWTQTFVSNGSANASPNVSEEGSKCQTVNINKLIDENTVNFGNYQTPSVDYCDPTQRPTGMSIAAWHEANDFDGSSCFTYEVTKQCGSLDVQFTKNDTGYDYLFYYAIGSLTPELVNWEGDGPLPVNFAEDENGGSVNVTYYAVGPEKDFIVGSDIPNIWDGNGETVTINTDCESVPVDPVVPEVCSAEGLVVSYSDPAYKNSTALVDANRRFVTAIEAGVAPYANFFGQEGNDWQVNPLDFFSLGIAGELVYEFTDKVAVDETGHDIAIWEITGGPADEQSEEAIEVWLSEDGVNFELADEITADGLVDIADTSLSFVKFVKLIDKSQGVQGDNGDGYDVDAITIVNDSCADFATLHTSKLVCTDESDLPNGAFSNTQITETTALDWIGTEHPSCELVSDWEFEWAESNAGDPGDTLVGSAGVDWNTFIGSTLIPESVLEDNSFWVREVLQENYIPFTNEANGGNSDDVTAEMYCHTDGLNYDNLDRVDNPEVGGDYYCVAWNVPVEPVDVCVNIDGTQTELPDGYEFVDDGVCELISQSVCQIGDNLLLNGSFEEPVIDGSWTLVNSVDWLTYKVSDGTPTKLEIWNNFMGGASDGDQNIELGGAEATRVSQTVTTVPGATYELRFDFSPRLNTGLAENSVNAMVDGDVLINATGDGSQLVENNWTTYSQTFVAEGNSTEITLADAGVDNSLGSLADNAVLCYVSDPKPTTARLDGYKYEMVEGGEQTPLSNWPIYAVSGEMEPLSTTTDNNGYFYFDVPKGDWRVYEGDVTDWNLVSIYQNGDLLPSEEDSCEFEVYPAEYKSITRVLFEVGPTVALTYHCEFYNEYIDNDDGDGDEEDTPKNTSTATRVGLRRANPAPMVAGISTTGQCPFLTDYMQIGMDNDPWEVTKLQMFLTIVMGLETPVTGVFDVITDRNVKIFQERYREDVLDPWYIRGIVPHSEATGFVYKTTLWKINSIVCPDYAVLPVFEGENLYSNVDLD